MALIAGDYTTINLLNKFHIERKSLGDLYGTLTSGHKRFRRELVRAEERGIELQVLIEGTKADMRAKRFPMGEDRLISGETVLKIVATLSKRTGVVFIWTKDRQAAKRRLLRILKAKEKEIPQRLKKKRSLTRLRP